MAKQRWFWVGLMLVVGIFSRWVPHPPDFAPILAIALFAGFVLPAPLALVMPIATMFLGDLYLGFHDMMWVVYLSLIPMVWLGSRLPKPSKYSSTWLQWGFYGLLASVLFFVTTNLYMWWYSGQYAHTADGLVSCFVLAIPFFHNSVLSTWVFMAAFAGIYLTVLNPARAAAAKSQIQ